jgi:DNA-binding CsgD family transcriptional regulator
VEGRGDEVERLSRLVRGAVAGRGATVLVEGEPGSGKTALLDVMCAEATRLGVRVLRGAGHERVPPEPFTAIRSCVGPGVPRSDQEFVVTEAILDLVAGWCTAGPVLLVLDDLQWADPPSMVVLSRLGRAVDHLPLVVAAAYRPAPRGDALDGLLSALDGGGALALTLGPLPASAVAALVERLAGAPPAPALLDLVASAAGNPRHIGELLHALEVRIIDGTATVPAGTGVPRPLVDAVRRRLDVLSDRAREALRVAAVLAPGFTLPELSTVLGTPVVATWEMVNEALGASLLANTDDRLVFRHELIREALATEVPAGLRRSLWRSAATALASAGAPVERVAEYLLAGDDLDPDALAWLDRVAGPLIARAPDLAAGLFARAPAAPLHLARAQLYAGRPAEAERTVRSALAAGPGPGAEGELRWLLVHARLHQGQVEPAIAEAERALAAHGVAAGPRGRLYGLLAQCLLLLGRTDAAESYAARAAGTQDGYAIACGRYVQAGVRLVEGRPHDGLALIERVLAGPATQPTRRDLALAPHAIRGFCLLELDRLAEADGAFETGMRDGDTAFLIWYHLGRARIRYLDGRWDEALAEIGTGLGTHDPFGVAQGLRSLAALITMHRGDFAAYPRLVDEPDTSLAGRHFGALRVTARALALEEQGVPVRALQLLLEHRDEGIGTLGPEIARIAAVAGAADEARSVALALDTLAGHHPAPTIRGTAMLCHGVATDDTDLVSAAAHEYGRAGWPLYEGYAYECAAAVLAQQRRPAESHAALDAALDRYRRLGATWDGARATNRLRRAGLRRRARQRPREGWSGLTETERRVAILVAAGRSGADIATELYLSRRTVQSHVSRILRKLGLSSRVELVGTVPENDSSSPIR